MILLDQPYVSPFLRQTVSDHRLPVVLTPAACELGFREAPGAISETAAIEQLRADPRARIMSNSENAIGWVARNLDFTPLPVAIDLFKNKLKFRRLVRDLYPDFKFQEVTAASLDDLDPVEFGTPFVIKPAVGFFSLGVHMVMQPEDWPGVRQAISRQMMNPDRPYPPQVLDSSSLLVEQVITGTEYAVDAYYDNDGQPVITNILQHLFSSEHDVSDRVYLTGEKIVSENLSRFTDFLTQVGNLARLRNFPVHVEVRVNRAGEIVPIEINPLRFGGWCTTADLTAMAYGFNPYVAYLNDLRPDWEAIFATRRDKVYSIIVLDNSTGWYGKSIAAFDIDRLTARFQKTLDVRPVDHTTYPLFGFILAETPADDLSELEWILHSDLREFVQTTR